MPDYTEIGPNPTIRPAATRNRGYRFLTVDYASRRVTHEFKFSGVQYSWERNLAGIFSATLDLYDPSTRFLRPQETYIVVERRGLPFWCGFLWQPTRSGKTLEISAQEVWSIFGHRHIRQTKDYFNEDRGAILRDLVSYAQEGPGGSLALTVGEGVVGGDTLSYKVPWWENKTIVEVADTIVHMDPSFTFRIEGRWLPGNVLGFNLVIDPVHPVPTKHRLIYGGNVDEYEWQPLSPSPNFIDGFGGFDNEAMIRRTVQNDEALTRQPRIEGSTENRELMGEEGVLKLATDTLRRMSGSPSQPAVVMQGDADPELGVLKPGHSAHVTIEDGYVHVDGEFNVEKINVSVPDGAADALGAETVTIEFESKLDEESVSTS